MGIRPCPFFPRSLGFYGTGGQGPAFNTDTFTETDICGAIQCVSSLSPFISGLLGTACDAENCPEAVSGCAELVTDILDPNNDFIACVPEGSLPTILRQLLVNLLNVCLCTVTLQGLRVGGVELEYRVNLENFQEEAVALGLIDEGEEDYCVTVLEIIMLANQFLENCTTANSKALADILTAMAKDAGETIIVFNSFCT